MATGMTKAEKMEQAAMQAQMAEMEEVIARLSGKERERDLLASETPRDTQARETQENAVKEIIANLERLGGKLHDDDDILFQGNKLTLPETMSIRQGRDFLDRKEKEQEAGTVFDRTFHYRPWDGAWCMWQVMKRTFGAVSHRGTVRFSFFGPMEDPLQMHTINSDVGKTEQVPWGEFALPHLPGVTFSTGAVNHPELGQLFRLSANGPKKHRFAVEGVFNLVEEELKTNSLYRGKALDGQEMPEFVDVFAIDPSKVVYSQEVYARLKALVWAQLRYTDQATDMDVRLKKSVLLHGGFGTGKTLAIMLTGQEALKAGWTFIKARPGRDDLTKVLQTAKLYQPCVVAYEDLDRIASAEHDETINRLLDDVDGIEAKTARILCVMTTNKPEKIHAGMIRPGRLDHLIEIEDLDKQGVESLVKVTIPESRLADDIDWKQVHEDAQGYKPAFITGFAENAKLFLLARTDGQIGDEKITTEDLSYAARGLRPQYERMQGAKDTPGEESLALALDKRLKGVLEETVAPQLLAANQ